MYNGMPQAYPTSAVTVSGANGLSSSNGTLSVTYNGSGAVPTAAGTYTVQATFTPADTADYTQGMATATWTIRPARPVVHTVNESTVYNGSPQAYPLASGDATVTGVAAGADQTPGGAFTYSYASASYGPSSSPPTMAGTYKVTVTFNTSDPNYTTGVTHTAVLTIKRAVPAITWTVPGAIFSTTALRATQLDAVASVPGTLLYSPAAGTLLSAGTHTLSVKFIPSDAADYTDATATVKLLVQRHVRTVHGHAVSLARPGRRQQ